MMSVCAHLNVEGLERQAFTRNQTRCGVVIIEATREGRRDIDVTLFVDTPEQADAIAAAINAALARPLQHQAA